MRSLLIDDVRQPLDYKTSIARDTKAGCALVEHGGPWDILLLDHDLGPGGCGQTIVDLLEKMDATDRPDMVVIVSMNPVGVENMARVLKKLYYFEAGNRTFSISEEKFKTYEDGEHLIGVRS
jgi:hypothetical protein